MFIVFIVDLYIIYSPGLNLLLLQRNAQPPARSLALLLTPQDLYTSRRGCVANGIMPNRHRSRSISPPLSASKRSSALPACSVS